ncbi:MAG TPA: hypothetical protein V6C97_27155 [Oculatellaceae cyanobacterium]
MTVSGWVNFVGSKSHKKQDGSERVSRYVIVEGLLLGLGPGLEVPEKGKRICCEAAEQEYKDKSGAHKRAFRVVGWSYAANPAGTR